jgi:hypothetical protein
MLRFEAKVHIPVASRKKPINKSLMFRESIFSLAENHEWHENAHIYVNIYFSAKIYCFFFESSEHMVCNLLKAAIKGEKFMEN